KMSAARRVAPGWTPGGITTNPDGSVSFEEPPAEQVEPARATTVLVRARDGVSPNELDARVEEIFDAFRNDKMPRDEDWVPGRGGESTVDTWEQAPDLRYSLAAVKKEPPLVLVLFALISLVSVVLLFSIFWSMVSEKTKDVGVLRALGASRAGVAWLFMRY